MRPVVAIVSARPETIADDYRRLFELSGLGNRPSKESTICAGKASRGNHSLGQVCPPWQIEAILNKLSTVQEPLADKRSEACMLLSVANSGPSVNIRGLGWDTVLNDNDLKPANADTIAVSPFRPQALLPALESVLPQGFKISPHLRGKDLLLLSTMNFESGGTLGANVALLAHLLVPERKPSGKTPLVEIMAEVVGLGHDVFSSMGAVTDATVVSVVRKGGAHVTLVRNLLIAGNDPVAVDSVLAKLSGLDPSDSPWLGLCQERNLGVSDLESIRLVGETEWLDLDFQIPEDTFASGNPVTQWTPGNLWDRVFSRGPRGQNPHQESAWDRLFREFQSGVTS